MATIFSSYQTIVTVSVAEKARSEPLYAGFVAALTLQTVVLTATMVTELLDLGTAVGKMFLLTTMPVFFLANAVSKQNGDTIMFIVISQMSILYCCLYSVRLSVSAYVQYTGASPD